MNREHWSIFCWSFFKYLF